MADDTSTSAFTQAMRRRAAKVQQARKVKPGDFKIQLPLGEYVTEFVNAKMATDKNDNPYVSFQFVVQSPQETETGFKSAGKQIFVSHFINESDFQTEDQALERLFSDMQLMGAVVSTYDYDDIAPGITDLVNLKPNVKVEICESKKGNKFPKIKGVVKNLAEQASFSIDTSNDDFAIDIGKVWDYRSLNCTIADINFDASTLDLVGPDGEEFNNVSFNDEELGNEVIN